jgi:hypothetical protein
MLAIENAWNRAKELRPALLSQAVRQISLQHQAYDRLSSIIDSLGKRSDEARGRVA